MLNRILAVIAAVFTLVASPALAQERLVSPPLDGFVIGNDRSDGIQSIREEHPAGENLRDWTVIVTTQSVALPNFGAMRFARNFIGQLDAVCPGSDVEEPVRSERNGYEVATLSFICSSSPTSNDAEDTRVMIMQGSDLLYVKQVAFRPGYEGNREWADAFLANTRIEGRPLPRK